MKLLINGFNTLGFAVPLISELFMFIDHLIYWCANLAFQTFYEIANLSAGISYLSPEVVAIMNRVMVLAGIYALFRVAVMLINYLIHPDKVSELNKDSSTIVSRIVIAIILLISCQFIFQQLGRFQSLIIDNNIIPKLVYGPGDDSVSEANKISDQTERFVNNVWLLFYRPRGKDCVNDNSGSCLAYNRVKNGETGSILALVGANYTDFDYFPVVSGIVGIVLIYYFVRFTVSLGVRVFKLFVLQVIAPIPIIMSVDPARKNQVSVFAKTYFGIYIQVFLRIFTFYLAFVAIDILGALPDVVSSASSSGMLMASNLGLFAQVLLLFAVFQAAQELPKLIEEALSVKLGLDTGSKGFGGVLKGIIGGTAGLVGGAVAGGVAGGVGGALAGGASGMWNAGIGAAAGKNAAAGVSATVAAVGKSSDLGRRISKSNGLIGYGLGKFDNFTGRTASIDREVSSATSRVDAYKGFEDAVLSDYSKSIDASTGLKVGSMDQDAGVMLAKGNLNSFVDEYSRAPIDASGNRTVNGVSYSSLAAKSHIDSLRTAVDSSEEAYKLKAFNWFNTTSLDSSRPNGIKYDPKKYSTMSFSEKAHHELTRVNKGTTLVPDASAGIDLRTAFKSQQKTAIKAKTEAEDQQKTDRYRNAQTASKK